MRTPLPFSDPDGLMMLLYYVDPETPAEPDRPNVGPIGIRHSDGVDHLSVSNALTAWSKVAPPGMAAPVDAVGLVVSGPVIEDLEERKIAKIPRRLPGGDFDVRLSVNARDAIAAGARTVAEVVAAMIPAPTPPVSISIGTNHGAFTASGNVTQTITITQQTYRSTITALTGIGFSPAQAFDLAETVQAEVIETGQGELGSRGRELLDATIRELGSGAASAAGGKMLEAALPVLGDLAMAVFAAGSSLI